MSCSINNLARFRSSQEGTRPTISLGLQAYSTHSSQEEETICIGTSIVPFIDAFGRPLLEATARLLHRLTQLAFPQSFAKGMCMMSPMRSRLPFSIRLRKLCVAETRTSVVSSQAFQVPRSSVPG